MEEEEEEGEGKKKEEEDGEEAEEEEFATKYKWNLQNNLLQFSELFRFRYPR